MRHLRIWGFRLLMLSLVLVGCTLHKEILPTHDEVLIYNLPYDLTYLRTLEAIENLDDWDIEKTVKEQGIIEARNFNFSKFDDSDQRMVRILIGRKNRFQTEVKLDVGSQRIFGVGKIMEQISQYLSREA